MSEEDDTDKQYDASEQKLRKAREQGDIPRSTEVNSALMYLGFWVAIALMGAVAVPAWLRQASRAIGAEPWPDARGHSVFDLATSMAGAAALMTLAGIALMGICTLVGLIVQRSVVFTPKKLVPDINRINPFKNAKQKFGKSGLVTFAISVGKAALVALGGWLLFRSLIVMLTNTNVMGDLQWVAGLDLILNRVILLAVGVSVVFGGIDFLWKRFEHQRRNRMSRKEMTDEHKENEGDPHMKASRRQKGFDIVMNRMLDDVAKADVVIVNPTHYAVALEWKRGSGRAPVCLAKGVDEVARRIRERAKENGVPIFSDPPSARAIHAMIDIGDEIRTEHFAAVAAAIRFAEAMRKKARAGWGGTWLRGNTSGADPAGKRSVGKGGRK